MSNTHFTLKILQNLGAMVSHPALAWEFLRFELSRLQHGGELVREFPADGLQIGGLSGFSEFHSCVNFISPSERSFLTSPIFGDGAVIDVGGNLGIVSLMLAKHFPDLMIYAFEPNPSTFKTMTANFKRNQCSNLYPFAKAIAGYDGDICFLADPVNRATNHIVLEDGLQAQSKIPVVKVPCITLDSFAFEQKLEEISLLKVDVEGYEELVFAGAERLLSTGAVRTIFYEVCPALARQAGFAPDDASRRLIGHGYELHTLDQEGRLKPAEIDRIKSVNLENWIATRKDISS